MRLSVREVQEPCRERGSGAAWSASGSAPSATTSKRPKREKDNAGSAGAERQQHFVADVFLEIREIERLLALVAQHFDHRGAAFFVRFHPRRRATGRRASAGS